jgi:hypothetical protein
MVGSALSPKPRSDGPITSSGALEVNVMLEKVREKTRNWSKNSQMEGNCLISETKLSYGLVL